MQKFNIAKPEKYMKDGVEKTFWHTVGTITMFEKPDGTPSYIVEIPAIGLKANAFPVERKEEPKPQPAAVREDRIEYPVEDINPEDIPF